MHFKNALRWMRQASSPCPTEPAVLPSGGSPSLSFTETRSICLEALWIPSHPNKDARRLDFQTAISKRKHHEPTEREQNPGPGWHGHAGPQNVSAASEAISGDLLHDSRLNR